MVATSTVVTFGLMYLNIYALDHVFFSQTRAWMALLTGTVMALIMLGFTWGMYKKPGGQRRHTGRRRGGFHGIPLPH